MAKEFFTAIIAKGGFAGEYFDLNVGPLEEDIVDQLFATAITSPVVLQENTPINLISTGVLGATKELDLQNVEQNGRLIFVSIRNSDIAFNNITITPTSTINGNPNLTINSAVDFILAHETGGIWRAYFQTTSATGGSGGAFTAAEKDNLELEMEFKASQLTTYKEFLYAGNNLIQTDTYVDNTKTIQIFSKTFSYTGKNLTQTVLTRISDAATLTRTFVYTGNQLTSIETT